MALPQNDPSLPGGPTPLFSDVDAARGDHMRANNQAIWLNLEYLNISKNINDAAAAMPVDADKLGFWQVAGLTLKHFLWSDLKSLVIAAAQTAFANLFVPVGTYIQHAGRTAPAGYLACNGAAVSRTTYADLYLRLCPTLGSFTVTIASPAVVTLTAHGLQNGDRVRLFTTGALPTNLVENTDYFVKNATADTFRLATTPGGADINTTGTQSGTHTLQSFQHGAGDGSTTFNLPDARGLVMVGAGAHGSMTRANGAAFNGGSVGASRDDQMQGHNHIQAFGISASPGERYGRKSGLSGVNQYADWDFVSGAATYTEAPLTSAQNSDGTNGTPRIGDETRPAEIAVLVCIKF